MNSDEVGKNLTAVPADIVVSGWLAASIVMTRAVLGGLNQHADGSLGPSALCRSQIRGYYPERRIDCPQCTMGWMGLS